MGVWFVFSYLKKQVMKKLSTIVVILKNYLLYFILVESLCRLGSSLACLLLVNSHLHAEMTTGMVKYVKYC